MEQEELKRKLMGLWEKTTHNSKELIATLFDYYFDIRYIEYKEIEGKVVSAIFGIPYEFGLRRKSLKGLYLISLSSEEGYRKKGILAELLNNFNERVKNEFDFTFLVPHTELMSDYYGTQGYLSSFFILEERYTPLHDFKNEYFYSLTDSDDRIKELKKNLMNEIKIMAYEEDSVFTKDQIINFIQEIEKKSSASVNLYHNKRDLDYLLQENNLRNLIAYIAYDSDGRITGVAFTEKEDLKRIKIIANYISDSCSYFSLLEYIKKKNPDHSISVVTSDLKYQTYSLIQHNYAATNPAGNDLDNTFGTVEIPYNINKLLQPLGMVKLLRFNNIIQYIAETRSDVDFKIFIRDYEIEPLSNENNENVEAEGAINEEVIFVVKNGKFKVEPLKNNRKDHSILNLTKKEFSELLLRKNDSSNLIMEAFGIPRINLQMRILPY